MRYRNRAAAPAHLQTKTELKEQRLKPAGTQRAAGYYWQGHGYVTLYDPAEAVSMRPRRELSSAQAAALAAGRALLGTASCGCCGKRVDTAGLDRIGRCCECVLQEQRDQWAQEERAVRAYAAELLAQEPLFLDTETTGLDVQAEIVEIAILDHQGGVLLNTLVQPTQSIRPEASAINGITEQDVAIAPRWTAVGEEVARILSGRRVISHGAEFDKRMLRQTNTRYGVLMPVFRLECTMELLTGLNGGRWPRLADAARISGAEMSTGMAHRARSDAESCRQIILALARQAGSTASPNAIALDSEGSERRAIG